MKKKKKRKNKKFDILSFCSIIGLDLSLTTDQKGDLDADRIKEVLQDLHIQ